MYEVEPVGDDGRPQKCVGKLHWIVQISK